MKGRIRFERQYKREEESENEGDEKRTEIGDGCVLGLTRSVGDHDTPSIGLGELSTVDSKRENEISTTISMSRRQITLEIKGTHALIDSVMVPIWLTLRRRPLQAFFSMAL